MYHERRKSDDPTCTWYDSLAACAQAIDDLAALVVHIAKRSGLDAKEVRAGARPTNSTEATKITKPTDHDRTRRCQG